MKREEISVGTGFTMEMSWVSKQFLEFSKGKALPICDVGAAYGVATLPALEQGNTVIAIEQNPVHLATLDSRVPEALKDSLTCIQANFPDDAVDVEEGACAAILCSHMLAFLSGIRMGKAIPELYRWLAPGGKLFIINFTPYNALLSRFLPVYEARKSQGQAWPGWVDNIFDYMPRNSISENLPVSANYFDKGVLAKEFVAAGFRVEFDDYLSGDENLKFPDVALDGRELHGLIVSTET